MLRNIVLFATMALLLVASSTGFISVQSNTIGNVLYTQNFSGANGSEPANWYHDLGYSIQNGWYQAIQPKVKGGWTVAYYTGQKFSNFSLSATAEGLSGCNQLPPVLSVVFRAQSRTNLYGFWADIDKLQLWKYVNGFPVVMQTIGSIKINSTGTPYVLTVEANGSHLQAFFSNGIKSYHLSVDDSSFSSGYVGVATYNCNARFTNVVVSSLANPTASTTSSTNTSASSSSTSTQSTITVTNQIAVTKTDTETCLSCVVVTTNQTVTVNQTQVQTTP